MHLNSKYIDPNPYFGRPKMIVLSSIIPNFLNTKIYFLIHFLMLVISC